MPQTASAKKALRVSARRRAVNDKWRQKVREGVREFKDALKAQDKKQLHAVFTKVQSVLDRAVKHNILHRNTVARQKSRFSAAIAKIKS